MASNTKSLIWKLSHFCSTPPFFSLNISASPQACYSSFHFRDQTRKQVALTPRSLPAWSERGVNPFAFLKLGSSFEALHPQALLFPIISVKPHTAPYPLPSCSCPEQWCLCRFPGLLSVLICWEWLSSLLWTCFLHLALGRPPFLSSLR